MQKNLPLNNEKDEEQQEELMAINRQHQLDNDIKNELLELANQVNQTFSNNFDEEKNSLLNDNESDKYESLSQIKQNNFNEHDDDDDDDESTNFKLPDLDWENLEAKLKEANQEINKQNKRTNFNNERDEIRRKLAVINSSSLENDSNNYYSSINSENVISDYLRKTNSSKTNYLGQNLQICFMNESSLNDDLVENDSSTKLIEEKQNQNSKLNSNKNDINKSTCSSSSLSLFSLSPSEDSNDDIFSQHYKLQNETKQALAKVQSEVRAIIEKEQKLSKKASPIADIVGLPTYGLKRLEREHIVDMNIGQLQVIANDLCNQIEKINEELKLMLIERDDLYLNQDSILVDIEDLTKRIQEYGLKYKKLNSENNDQSGISKSAKSALNSTSNIINSNTNSSNQKYKIFQLGSFTNKLNRFTKKS